MGLARVAFAVLFLGCSVLVACDDSSEFPPRLTGDFTHPLDDTLRFNELQMLATHNSYHVRETPSPIPDWDYSFAPISEQLESQGVRGLELDLHYVGEESGGPSYDVYHLSLDPGSNCKTFEDCLGEIRRFSDAHPGHHPLFVQVELKEIPAAEVTDAQLELIDESIRSVFPPALLVTPDQVRGTHATLRDAILTDGWPTLAESRGKVFFALECVRAVCVQYAHGGTDLDGRVAFADSLETDPFAAVMIINTPDAFAQSLVEKGYVVRVMADSAAEIVTGKPDHLAAALASGGQIVSTDFPAPVAGIDYVASIPGGTPSRCNPINAPPGCTSTDVEDPALLTGRH